MRIGQIWIVKKNGQETLWKVTEVKEGPEFDEVIAHPVQSVISHGINFGKPWCDFKTKTGPMEAPISENAEWRLFTEVLN